MRRILFLTLALLALGVPALTTLTTSAQEAAPTAAEADAAGPAEPKCFGKVATNPDRVGFIVGTPGNDVLIGDNRDNFFRGNGGVDRICGGGGNDSVSANGDDGQSRRLLVNGGAGND